MGRPELTESRFIGIERIPEGSSPAQTLRLGAPSNVVALVMRACERDKELLLEILKFAKLK